MDEVEIRKQEVAWSRITNKTERTNCALGKRMRHEQEGLEHPGPLHEARQKV